MLGCFSPEPHGGIPCTGDGMCPEGLKCRPSSGTCEVDVAGDGSVGDVAEDASRFFAPLNGKQWLMPCAAPPNPTLCDANDFNSAVVMVGTDSRRYDVRVRIRGAMERGTYVNGDGSDPNGWYVGGMPAGSTLTATSVEVSEPAGTYWLNSVMAAGGLVTLDYEVTLRIAANAQVKLYMSALDGRARADAMAPVIAGVVTTPSPYLGQFAQIDVESAVLVP
jgi:hypothetical protein